MLFTLVLAGLIALSGVRTATLPSPIYGVNLGNWLVAEPWMMPEEWTAMGGQHCPVCTDCIGSEFAFAKSFPQDVDDKFQKHWESWFNEADVKNIKEAGINTVRIPLGYWIVEALVDRKTEFFPKGGLKQLRRGLKQLKDAGITAILDHHALPGTASPNQQFAGRCVKDADVQFYTSKNYHRALVWTAVITAITHIDPNFSSVASVQAINEPIMDAMKTPGYGDFLKNFVETVRAVETVLGITTPDFAVEIKRVVKSNNLAEYLNSAATAGVFNPLVSTALIEAVPILTKIGLENSLSMLLNFNTRNREPLQTMTMNAQWQRNVQANPAEAKFGPQVYDNHLYYCFGGVADANEEAYFRHICNLNYVEEAAKVGNSPLVFGEWSLCNQFNATGEFMRNWADSQKLAYSKGSGWIFWNFKIEKSKTSGDTPKFWSYLEGLEQGYFTKDPSQYNNPHVCDKYMGPAPPKPTNNKDSDEPSKKATKPDGAEEGKSTTAVAKRSIYHKYGRAMRAYFKRSGDVKQRQ